MLLWRLSTCSHRYKTQGVQTAEHFRQPPQKQNCRSLFHHIGRVNKQGAAYIHYHTHTSIKSRIRVEKLQSMCLCELCGVYNNLEWDLITKIIGHNCLSQATGKLSSNNYSTLFMCWNLLSALQKNHLHNGIVGNFLPVFVKAVISGFIYLLKQCITE